MESPGGPCELMGDKLRTNEKTWQMLEAEIISPLKEKINGIDNLALVTIALEKQASLPTILLPM